jgi:hypothetical protein
VGHEVGDKVRIRHDGRRGVVTGVDGIYLVVKTDVGSERIALNEVTNYSLAARRAWRTRPKRAGRPRLASPRKRMISLRLDIDVLDGLAILVEHGLIESREGAINVWLRERIRSVSKTSIP